MRLINRYLISYLISSLLSGCAGLTHPLRVVNVPVTDLRAQPGSLSRAGAHDPFEETQLLYGEPVRLFKTEGAWAFVEAIEQREFTHNNRWQGYPGWMLVDTLSPPQPRGRQHAVVTAKWATVWQEPGGIGSPWFTLPMGTKLSVVDSNGIFWKIRLVSGRPAWIPSGQVKRLQEVRALRVSDKRRAILRAAEELLGDPYYWGGRSPFRGDHTSATSTDCSGLVNLTYRTVGKDLPRDAHEQYLRARKIATPQPADLIFLSEAENPAKIVHVMLYAGDDWLIEGPGTGLSIRRVAISQRLGKPLAQLRPGSTVNNQTVFFGTYLP